MISSTYLGQGSINLVRSPGTYEYRTRAVEEFYHNRYEPDIRFVFSTPITVNVVAGEIPSFDSLTTQLGYEYETRIGDINNDGRQDIFVDRLTVADQGNGTIDTLLLIQTAGGQFYSQVPSASQTNTASNWPVADIYLDVMDVNLDGFVDIFLRELGDIIPGALSQIVFAPAEIFVTQPLGTKSIDAETTKFLNEFRAWTEDGNYFYDNAIWVEEPGYWDYEIECEFFWWGDWPEWICYYYPVYVDGAEYWSYSHFNQDALELANLFGGRFFDGSLSALSEKAAKVVEIFERIFGVGVFGGVLGTGGVGGWEIEIGVGDNDRGLVLIWQIFEVTEETAPRDWRPLTWNEKIFLEGNGFDIPRVDKVRLYRKAYPPLSKVGGGTQVMAPNGNIYIPPGNVSFGTEWLWSEDYVFENDWSTMTFLHESFHVYEYRSSRFRLGGLSMLLKRVPNSAYYYTIEPGKDFWDYGLEQRATIIMERWYLGTTGRITGYGGQVTMQELNQVIPFTCVVCQ